MFEVATVKPDSTDPIDIISEYHLYDEIFLEWGVLSARRWKMPNNSTGMTDLQYEESLYSMDRSSLGVTIEISPLYIKMWWPRSLAFICAENNKRNMDIIKEWQNLNL